ncbi:MAG: hypothetical protein AVDCRST_MAG30-2708, partial [uncultured Solirubrobacteraceae bacterium]
GAPDRRRARRAGRLRAGRPAATRPRRPAGGRGDRRARRARRRPRRQVPRDPRRGARLPDREALRGRLARAGPGAAGRRDRDPAPARRTRV